MQEIKIQDSKREKDANGFLIIKNNPIAKAGVFDYLLSELKEGISEKDDKIIKVCRPFNKLVEIKDTFANKPIKFNHKWVGEDSNVADGAIGSVISVDTEKEMLTADLIIYNPQLINAIEKDNIVELSPAYTAEAEEKAGRYNGSDYDFMQVIKCVNHLAVVDKGRSGSDLKILDNNLKVEKMKNKFKDSFYMHIKKFFDNEAESEKETQDSETETQDEAEVCDSDKREIIREIMALSAKDNSEFSGGENEKIETIAKLAEKLAYNETSDNEVETEKETEDADELVESEKVNAEELAEAVAEVTEAVIEKKLKEYEDKKAKELKHVSDTYAKVSDALGTSFDYSGMSANDIYKFGYEALSGKSLAEGLDSMTAFLMQTQEKRKFRDNALKTSDSKITKILKEKY